MFLTNLPRFGKAFLLLSLAMVESHQQGPQAPGGSGPMDMVMPPPLEECCTEKKVGPYTYTLLQGDFHGSIPHQCLNNCVYTLIGTSGPKFCFGRGSASFYTILELDFVFLLYLCCIHVFLLSTGDLPTECHDHDEAGKTMM